MLIYIYIYIYIIIIIILELSLVSKKCSMLASEQSSIMRNVSQ